MTEKLKKRIIGRIVRWVIRAFLNWRFYFKQLFWSYKYYHSKKLANTCDIKCKIKYVGERNTKFPHPVGVVIGMGVQLGNNCVLFQNITLGTKSLRFDDDYPKIGNNVIIGANAVLIGKIKIGNNVKVGASSFVNFDVPDNAVVVGNPARIIN